MRIAASVVIVLALALAGCAAAKDNMSDSSYGYVPDSKAASVDWSKAETVNVTLVDFEFQPARLAFQAGQPYRLHIENKSGSTHFFAAEGFFMAIATGALMEPRGTVEHPHLKEIALAPGESKDLTFVPVTAGTYDLRCTAPFHAGMGMIGSITIS